MHQSSDSRRNCRNRIYDVIFYYCRPLCVHLLRTVHCAAFSGQCLSNGTALLQPDSKSSLPTFAFSTVTWSQCRHVKCRNHTSAFTAATIKRSTWKLMQNGSSHYFCRPDSVLYLFGQSWKRFIFMASCAYEHWFCLIITSSYSHVFTRK